MQGKQNADKDLHAALSPSEIGGAAEMAEQMGQFSDDDIGKDSDEMLDGRRSEDGTMSSHERVMKALNFEQPDRVPRCELFWPEFVDKWRREKGLPDSASIYQHYRTPDILIAVGEEGIQPSGVGVVKSDDEYVWQRDSWGRVIKIRKGAWMQLPVEAALNDRRDLDKLDFEPADLDSRYEMVEATLPEMKKHYCLFAKTGGPFLRGTFIRGEEDFLMDMAEDPDWAAEFVMRLTDHLTQVGLEELRRFDLYETGAWIYDDIAANWGPMMSPQTWEKVFHPAYCKMIETWKRAGARRVLFHSDGNIWPVLDMLVEAGVDGINPLEYRASMDAVEVRKRYGNKLAILGGICNSEILPKGDKETIKQHVLRILSVGREGGLLIGSHSIGPDTPIESYDYYVELLDEYGQYPLEGRSKGEAPG